MRAIFYDENKRFFSIVIDNRGFASLLTILKFCFSKRFGEIALWKRVACVLNILRPPYLICEPRRKNPRRKPANHAPECKVNRIKFIVLVDFV